MLMLRSTNDEDIPRLILNQLRWLDFLEDGAHLVEKIKESLQICNPAVQRDIILCTPDIVEDEFHAEIVETLIDILDGDAQFVAPVLESLSNLNFSSNSVTAEAVLEKSLDLLSSANSSDVPTVLKFLLQFPNEDYLPRIISTIRKELKLDTLLDPEDDLLSQNKASIQSKDCEKLVFEALRSGIRFKQRIAICATKDEHYDIDFWLLIILSLVKSKEREASSILNDKIISGVFSSTMLRKWITFYSVATVEYDESPLVVLRLGY